MITSLPPTTTFTPRQALLSAMEFSDNDNLQDVLIIGYDDNELCEIIAASFRGQVKEWIEDDSGPRCTAFVEAGKEVPFVDTKTLDLFL